MLQLGLGLGLGPGNGILSFFFLLLCKCGGHRPGAWPALSMSHVSMTSSGMKRGEQSGSHVIVVGSKLRVGGGGYSLQ